MNLFAMVPGDFAATYAGHAPLINRLLYPPKAQPPSYAALLHFQFSEEEKTLYVPLPQKGDF